MYYSEIYCLYSHNTKKILTVFHDFIRFVWGYAQFFIILYENLFFTRFDTKSFFLLNFTYFLIRLYVAKKGYPLLYFYDFLFQFHSKTIVEKHLILFLLPPSTSSFYMYSWSIYSIISCCSNYYSKINSYTLSF